MGTRRVARAVPVPHDGAFDRGRPIGEQVKAVGHLHRARRPYTRAVGIRSASVAAKALS